MFNKLRRLTDHETGAAAIELAVIAPVIMLIIVGVFEFGILLNRVQVYEGAAREGARVAAVRETRATAEARIEAAAAGYPVNTSSIGFYIDGVLTGQSVPCENHSGKRIRVRWDQPISSVLDFPLFPNFSLTREIAGEFRCE